MPTIIPANRFHFGLTVADLSAAVRFYEVLLGVPPVKHFEDYARFDVADPPVVLVLHPGQAATEGALNHVGFRVADADALVEVQRRLEAHGIATVREENVECCYAVQTKFWVTDADHHMWEVYTLDDDAADHSPFGGDDPRQSSRPENQRPRITWQHALTSPLPPSLPYADGTVDEIILEGTFNAQIDSEERQRFLRDVYRALRPGGTVAVHGLVADRPFPGRPQLPGPAAMVEVIPLETLPADELQQTGLIGLQYDKWGDLHCFQVDGMELRELRLSAIKPLDAVGGASRTVLYRGPLSAVEDEQGRSYPRGERVVVDNATWQQFQCGPYTAHFTCFDGAA